MKRICFSLLLPSFLANGTSRHTDRVTDNSHTPACFAKGIVGIPQPILFGFGRIRPTDNGSVAGTANLLAGCRCITLTRPGRKHIACTNERPVLGKDYRHFGRFQAMR